MVFKRLLGAFGVGGPSVDTVLANSNTRPGQTLDGQIHILGGDHEAKIDQVVLELVTTTAYGHSTAVHRRRSNPHRTSPYRIDVAGRSDDRFSER